MATGDDVHRIALALPEVTERPWAGTPGFRVRNTSFLRIRSEAEGALVAFVADLDEKEALLAAEPEVFFTTAHYDGHPTVLVRLEAIGLEELAEVILDAWRARAPKRLLAAHAELTPADLLGPAGAG